MLNDQQIRSRFGLDHYIILNNFGPEEAAEFLNGLFSNWVDPEKRIELEAKYGSEANAEPISEGTFPFTEAGLHQFVAWACRNGNITNPRDLQSQLDTVLNRAIDDERHILSAQYMDAIANAG